MSNRLAAYYYTLIGAIGGLLGWFLSCWILDLLNTPSVPELARAAVKGPIIGACIGGLVCGRERAMTVDWRQGLGDGTRGAIYGAIGGLIAYPLAVVLMQQLGQNIAGRLVGFVCFGALIGIGEGLKWRSGQRALRGVLGGAVGGAVAAVLYHLIAQSISAEIADGLAWTAFGGLLGLGISTACIIANTAVLQVVQAPKGKLQGQYLPLGTRGAHDVIGNSRTASVPMITDPDLSEEHAVVTIQNREFFIRPLNGTVVIVEGRQLVGRRPLNHGDTVQMGGTTFRFLLLKDHQVVRKDDGSLQPENKQDREGILYR